MSLTDEIYAELVDGLKTGLDWPHFLAKYSASKGPLYNALGRFFNDLEPKDKALAEVQGELDTAGLELDSLDQRIKEAKSKITPLEEAENTLNEQIETLETKLAGKSELLEHTEELGKLGLDIERLRQLREALTEIGAKTGLKGKEAVSKFFEDLKDYETVIAAETLLKGLQNQIETKKLEAKKWQVEEEALRRKHNDLQGVIKVVYAFRAKGVKDSQLVTLHRILNNVESAEQFEKNLRQYGEVTKLVNARKEEIQSCEDRLTEAQSRRETLEKVSAKIEAAIDTLKVAGLKELKAMTEAAEKQLKAVASSGIRETQVVGQGVGKGLNDLFAQLDALGAKAIEVGRTVGIVEQQIRKDTLARDLLNLLQNPAAAGYEEHAPLVLVLLKSISVWANMDKSRLSFPSLVDKNLQEVVGYLGGG